MSGTLRAAVGLTLLAMLAAGGCNKDLVLWQAGIPNWSTKMKVASVVTRGDFLEAQLEMKGLDLVSWVPASEACRTVLTPGNEVEYNEGNPGGTWLSGNLRCAATGIGSLGVWRDRLPRPENRGGAIIARAQADYRKVYEDAAFVFLRGRFPLAGKIGWVGLDALIAVVPNAPACEGPIQRTVSSMQYTPTGPRVLTLVAGDGACPIQGLITPYRLITPDRRDVPAPADASFERGA